MSQLTIRFMFATVLVVLGALTAVHLHLLPAIVIVCMAICVLLQEDEDNA